jgi:outer membrane protein assembly factor BamE (lipoprotein component of BamABCDE complex)
MNERQVARFSIKEEWVRSEPDEVAQVFSLLKAVPVRVEMMFHTNTLEYIAISDKFKEVSRYDKIPEVTLIVSVDKNGLIESVEVSYDGAE